MASCELRQKGKRWEGTKRTYNAQIRPPGSVLLETPKLIRSSGMYGVGYVIVDEITK
jgi:hypothetical protein